MSRNPFMPPPYTCNVFTQQSLTFNALFNIIHQENDIDITLKSIGQVLSGISSIQPEFLFHSCSMCLENYLSNDQIVLLPCHPSHFFHFDCLRDWFKEYLNCPLCRKKFHHS